MKKADSEAKKRSKESQKEIEENVKEVGVDVVGGKDHRVPRGMGDTEDRGCIDAGDRWMKRGKGKTEWSDYSEKVIILRRCHGSNMRMILA